VRAATFRAAEARLWASTGARPTERRLDLRRNAASVRVQELGDGPPVVFVHGANTSGASWATLAARLDGFRRIVLDRPGTGLSDALPRPVDGASVGAFGETLLVDVLDALDLPRAHVVATSFGGFIALRSAAAHPDRIGRMVQFSWPAGAPVARIPAMMRLMTVPVVGRLLSAVPPTGRSVRMTFRGIGHGPSLDDGRITAQDLETYLALLRGTDTLRNELAMGRALLSPIRGRPGLALSDEVLASVDSPTHFIWGERDPFGGPDVARRVVDRMPNATLEIVPGAGHAPWLDELDRCVAATMTALSG
jgi:pimeloyl-ACP methyl ester carboxylesterase